MSERRTVIKQETIEALVEWLGRPDSMRSARLEIPRLHPNPEANAGRFVFTLTDLSRHRVHSCASMDLGRSIESTLISASADDKRNEGS